MEIITRFISEDIIQALGWTVIHSLWQAVGVALLLAGAMLALQKHTAQVRYTAAYVALVITFGLALFTFFDQLQLAKEVHSSTTFYTEEGNLIGTFSIKENGEFSVHVPSSLGQIFQRFANYFNEHMPLIVTVWFMGVAFFILRLLGGFAYVQQLKTTYTSPVAEKWQYLLEDLAAQIPVKRSVQLLESAIVKVPMVIGHFKPVILLPLGAVNGLTPAQVEAILAHELAHIARYDYLLHILQSVIEVFFYFNPAVWWMSAIIRTERENCCDDVAVALCGNQLTYAKALVALQEMSTATPHLAMTFANNKNQLLKRVQRILNQPQNKSDIMEKLTATCLLLAVLVGLSVSAARPYQSFEKEPDFFTDVDAEAAIDDNEVFYTDYYDEATGDYYSDNVMMGDTIPKGKRNGTFSYDDGEKQIEAKIKDNKIVRLKIDGEEIPASEMSKYESMVEEIMSNIPEPPLPPAAPPAPPAPPTPHAVPAPPAPPTPEVWNMRGPGKVTKEKDKNGNTFITIETGEGDHAVMEIRKDGTVIMDGKELKEGEAANVFGNMAMWDEAASREHEAQLAKLEADWKRQEEEWRKNEEKWHEQERAFAQQAADMEKKSREFARSGKHPNWDGVSTYMVEAVASDNIRKALEKELLKDGLIKSTSNYKFELSAKSVKVNEKELPDATAKKYIELYEKEANFKLKTNSRYTISQRMEE